MPRKAIAKEDKKVNKEKKALKPKVVKETAKVRSGVKIEKKTKTSAKIDIQAKQKVKKTVKEISVKEIKPEKKSVLKKTGKNSKFDTGSVDFQIKNFTSKISSLAKHLKIHPHDFDSRRGLLIMVGKRRRLLNYVKKNDAEKYEKLSKTLKLKI